MNINGNRTSFLISLVLFTGLRLGRAVVVLGPLCLGFTPLGQADVPRVKAQSLLVLQMG